MGLALAALALAACSGGAGAPSTAPGGCRSLNVIASTSILGDVAGEAAGLPAGVEVLMPPGADPHSFQASASQVAAVREADLVVVNGLGLEEGLHTVLEEAAADGVAVVEAAAFVEALPLAAGDQGPAGEGEEGASDPHLWQDPRRMAQVAAGLGEAFAAADPACAGRRRAAAAGYRDRLLALDAEVEAALASIPAANRILVTNHHTLGYFADRYGFEVAGVIIPGGATLAEPSPADLAVLVSVLRASGVRAVFAENTRPASLAATLAAELGGDVVVVSLYTDSLGGAGTGADTYIGMMRTNAGRIAAALGEP